MTDKTSKPETAQYDDEMQELFADVTELELAHTKIDDMVAALDADLSEEVVERARELAKNADFGPINRSPSGIAAASIYLASLLKNEKVTQPEIAARTDTSIVTIRDCYHELSEYEGYRTPKSQGRHRGVRKTDEDSTSLTEFVSGFFGGDADGR
jgi:transcription initiation factor TFIIIB Brf1 subunit/transcription initiation factor TFIIB